MTAAKNRFRDILDRNKDVRKATGGPGNRIFKTPEDLLQKGAEYFDWIDANPWMSEKATKMKASDHEEIEYYNLRRQRYPTISGFCHFAGISLNCYAKYQRGETGMELADDFAEATKLLDGFITDEKMSGAAAGIFIAQIVGRELGLVDKTETKMELTDDFDALMRSAADND